MTKIEAKIIKHSRCPRGHELITYELVFPRFILAELNTHRMFSKNSASSRAIPFKKMVEMVQNDPFIPIAWQTEHKGMQGNKYIIDEFAINQKRVIWYQTMKSTVTAAKRLNNNSEKGKADDITRTYTFTEIPNSSVTKQLCNRLLEPFMWHKVLLTTGLEGLRNFFSLRCPEYSFGENTGNPRVWKSKKDAIKDFPDWVTRNQLFWSSINKGQAEIHMMELSEIMYDAYNESVPQNLKEGEYHIPYDEELLDLAAGKGYTYNDIIKASTGLCARTSYITVGDEKIPSIETLIGIHDKMKDSVPFHASPYEHCSICPSQEEYDNSIRGSEKGWFRNYRGFIQYRDLIEN